METLNAICGLIGVVGLILIGIGRWMLKQEVSGMSWWWRFSVRFVPLADLLVLSRFWDTAKSGAFMALAGMLLLLPYGALQMYQSTDAKPGDSVAFMSGDAKASLYDAMRQEHLSRIESKQEKCAKLNQYLAAWYQSMQSRWPLIAHAKPDIVAQYNQEAAAYSAFRSVVNTENAELTKIQNQPYEFGNITNEEFEAFRIQQAKRYATASGPESGALPIPGISAR
jgi:hypothetical protein